MIITKSTPFTNEEIEKLREAYDAFIKTVFDIEKMICSASCVMHYESEEQLLAAGSRQEDLWGSGIDLETGIVSFNSFINIRPPQGNTSNEIQDTKIRQEVARLTKYFFSL